MKAKEKLAKEHQTTEEIIKSDFIRSTYSYLAGFDQAKNMIYQEVMELIEQPSFWFTPIKNGLRLKKLIREVGEQDVKE